MANGRQAEQRLVHAFSILAVVRRPNLSENLAFEIGL